MSPKNPFPHPEIYKAYSELIEQFDEVELKGKKMPYTANNGYMFSFLSQDGSMGLRLGKEAREAFLEEYDTKLKIERGHVMKEFVHVPKEIQNNIKEIKKHFINSLVYTSTLKPK